MDPTAANPPVPATAAANSNNGSLSTTTFSPILEINPQFVVHLTPNINFQAGYTVIWVGNVLRAAEQVDIGGIKSGRPPVLSRQNDDIFLHGFTFSLSAHW